MSSVSRLASYPSHMFDVDPFIGHIIAASSVKPGRAELGVSPDMKLIRCMTQMHYLCPDCPVRMVTCRPCALFHVSKAFIGLVSPPYYGLGILT